MNNVPEAEEVARLFYPIAHAIRSHAYASGVVLLQVNFQFPKSEFDAAKGAGRAPEFVASCLGGKLPGPVEGPPSGFVHEAAFQATVQQRIALEERCAFLHEEVRLLRRERDGLRDLVESVSNMLKG